MPTGALSDIRKEWETLLETIQTNAEDLPFLGPYRTQLTGELDGLKAASLRQGTFKAQFQQATRDVEGHRKRGQDLATRLRNGIRSAYGMTAEKLTEFGLQPRRNRPKKKPQETGSSPTAPTASSTTASTIKE